MGLEAQCIPPAVDLGRFAEAAEHVNGSRAGAVSVGSWRNHGKAPHKAAEWGARNGGVEFYGAGPMSPPGCAEVPYDQMPALLASYETFVFLPTVLEPFGRLVAEAWAAGCRIVTNELVGAGYWLRENPEAIETSASDFWQIAVQQ
jgi:glycosyltransferase involved in cell wall biosynthesis